jgi:hypothetical protein
VLGEVGTVDRVIATTTKEGPVTRTPTDRPTAVRTNPHASTAATGVPLTIREQATGNGHRARNRPTTTAHAHFEQLRLW